MKEEGEEGGLTNVWRCIERRRRRRRKEEGAARLSFPLYAQKKTFSGRDKEKGKEEEGGSRSFKKRGKIFELFSLYQ